MKILKGILKTADSLVNIIVVFSLILAGLYAMYALYDNNQIYAAAGNVQEDMLRLKPEVDEEVGPSFEELISINPDVMGWVSMDNTNIDHPILQGEHNLSYINTDVYGNFALAGSIFLDSRNDGEFKDSYSLLYGHDMDQDKMFGNLSLYKEEAFFRENTTGNLIVPNGLYNLETYALLLVTASDDYIFEPSQWNENNLDHLIDYIDENAMYINNDLKTKLDGSARNDLQILSLSTCSGEFTDARTIIITIMENVSHIR